MTENAVLYVFITFLVLSVIVLLYSKKEIIIINDIIRLLHNENIYSGRTKQAKGPPV